MDRVQAIMRVSRTDHLSRKAVALVDLAITNMGWIFREQPTSDYGIDAQVELVDASRNVTGRLLALQIKGGPHYFREPTNGGFVYRPDKEHLEYWVRHQLEVLIVIVDLEKEKCYWQHVSKERLEKSRGAKGWKLIIPTQQALEPSLSTDIAKLAEADMPTLRYRRLQLARPWMELLENGASIRLEVAEWVNKIWGKGDLTLIVTPSDGGAENRFRWPVIAPGSTPYTEVLPGLFPWANLEIDADFYEDNFEPDHFPSRITESKIYPYRNQMDEVDDWRLVLTLSDLGRSFMRVDDYCSRLTDWWALPPP